MKPYAEWSCCVADVTYNCHICGRSVVKGDACYANDIWRVHAECWKDNAPPAFEIELSQLELLDMVLKGLIFSGRIRTGNLGPTDLRMQGQAIRVRVWYDKGLDGPKKPLYVGDGHPRLRNQVGGFPPHVMCARCSGPCTNTVQTWMNQDGSVFCGVDCWEASSRAEPAVYEPDAAEPAPESDP